MSKFGVSPEKEAALIDQMLRLGIKEADFEENFIRGGGPGGQKINKSSTCVQLIHKASGIEIRCQQARSQAMNRFLARRLLCERLEAIQLGKESRAEQERQKIKRQKRRRSRKAKEKVLQQKHIQSKKKLNRRINTDD